MLSSSEQQNNIFYVKMFNFIDYQLTVLFPLCLFWSALAHGLSMLHTENKGEITHKKIEKEAITDELQETYMYVYTVLNQC